MDRTYEQMAAEAHARLDSIIKNDEEPGECHFLVTPAERSLLRYQPFVSNTEPMTFYGMRITVLPR